MRCSRPRPRRLPFVLAIGSGEGGDGKPISRGDAGGVQRRPEPVRFTIEASGDLLIHTAVWERALALGGGDYDFAPLFKEIKPYVAGADLALCHVETPMTPAPPTSYPIFNTPPALAQGVKATGWDACDTASNHSLDQAQTGIDATARRSTTPGSSTRARSRRRPRSESP